MEMIVLSGIQASGKTTFFNARFAKTHLHLSLDVVGTRNRENILLFACLAAGQPVVIDNTNPTRQQRSRYASLARAAEFKTILYFFIVDIENAIQRNATRPMPSRVPDIGLRGTFAKLQEPAMDEPFDQIFRVTYSGCGDSIVEELSNEIR